MIRSVVSLLVPDAVRAYSIVFNLQKFFQTQEIDLPILLARRSVYFTPALTYVRVDGDFFAVAKVIIFAYIIAYTV